MSPNVIKKIFIKEKIMEEMMEDVVEETTVSKKPVGKLDKFFGITESLHLRKQKRESFSTRTTS